MKKAILATKVGMTQIFNADGVLVPVTVLQAGPCVVTQIKTVDNDGYSAVQVGFVDKKEKTVNKDANGKKEIRNRHGVNKAQMGHFAKAGVSGKRFVREFKFENADEYKLADEIKADIFAEGDKVDVTAISKGKGFQGAIKREMNNKKWFFFAIGYQTILGYVVALCIYQLGTLFTGGTFGVGTVVAILLVIGFGYLLFRPYKESTSLKIDSKKLAKN